MITEQYSKLNINLSSGSEDWVDLKTDYELIDLALAGHLAFDYEHDLHLDQAIIDKNNMESYKKRVEAYNVLDEIESGEKETSLKKIELGSKIYSELISKAK